MKYYWIGMLIIWIVLLSSIIQMLAIDKKRIEQFINNVQKKEHVELSGNEKEFIYLQKTYANNKRVLIPLIVGCVISIVDCAVQIILIGG